MVLMIYLLSTEHNITSGSYPINNQWRPQVKTSNLFSERPLDNNHSIVVVVTWDKNNLAWKYLKLK